MQKWNRSQAGVGIFSKPCCWLIVLMNGVWILACLSGGITGTHRMWKVACKYWFNVTVCIYVFDNRYCVCKIYNKFVFLFLLSSAKHQNMTLEEDYNCSSVSNIGVLLRIREGTENVFNLQSEQETKIVYGNGAEYSVLILQLENRTKSAYQRRFCIFVCVFAVGIVNQKYQKRVQHTPETGWPYPSCLSLGYFPGCKRCQYYRWDAGPLPACKGSQAGGFSCKGKCNAHFLASRDPFLFFSPHPSRDVFVSLWQLCPCEIGLAPAWEGTSWISRSTLTVVRPYRLQQPLNLWWGIGDGKGWDTVRTLQLSPLFIFKEAYLSVSD